MVVTEVTSGEGALQAPACRGQCIVFKMAQVGSLQRRLCGGLSCHFAADVCPAFSGDLSFSWQRFHVCFCYLVIEVDDYFYQQLWREGKKEDSIFVEIVFVNSSNFLPLC